MVSALVTWREFSNDCGFKTQVKRRSRFSGVAAAVFFFANICPSRETHIVFASPNGYCYFGKDNSKLSLTREN